MSSAPEEPESASEPSAAPAAEPVAMPRPLPPLPQGEPVWVDTAAGLAAAAERWMAGPTLALDTEFVRERTFYPRLGLIQVADASTIYLVDPLAVRDLSPLAAVCRAPGVLKVLHSASEDVEVFYRAVLTRRNHPAITLRKGADLEAERGRFAETDRAFQERQSEAVRIKLLGHAIPSGSCVGMNAIATVENSEPKLRAPWTSRPTSTS